MSAWVEGLLGAVMGGAQEYGTILKEEEAAKRKEEEEKRREERALTLAERQEAMREAREKRQEEAKRMAAEKERQAIAQTAPSKAPETGIVGNAIDEYQGEIANTGYTGQTRQATPEEALRWSINKAREEGREDLAKQREEALYKMLEEGRRASKEAREQQEFARGKPEKATEATRSFEANVLAAYTGPKDAEGNPLDPEDFGKFRARAANARLFGRERPEGTGGEKPPRAITPKEETAARNSLQRDLARLSEVTDAKGKVARDPLMWESLNKVTSRIIKEDRAKLLDPGLADEARAEVQAAIERARTDIRADLEKKTDAKGEPLPRDQIRKNEAILRNQYSFDRYSKENLPKYVNRYLGGGAAEEPKRGGKPWERSWGSME